MLFFLRSSLYFISKWGSSLRTEHWLFSSRIPDENHDWLNEELHSEWTMIGKSWNEWNFKFLWWNINYREKNYKYTSKRLKKWIKLKCKTKSLSNFSIFLTFLTLLTNMALIPLISSSFTVWNIPGLRFVIIMSFSRCK